MARIGFITERMILGHGVDLAIHQIADGLSQKGHAVTVLTTRADGTYQNTGYRIELFPSPSYFNPLLAEYAAVRAYRKFIEKYDFDLLFLHTYPFMPYSLLSEAPTIAVDYGVSPLIGYPVHMQWRYWYEELTRKRIYFKQADRILTISDFLKRQLPLELQNKTQVIHLGSDHYARPKEKETENFKKSLGITGGEVVMLYVGRLNHEKQPYKRIRELIHVYRSVKRKVKSAKLVVTGFGDEADRKWLESEGATVIVNAHPQLMPLLFSATDIYATCTQWEGFDLPVAEAQYFGKPVVCYDIGAHSELVKNGRTGYLVDSQEEFVKKIVQLANNKKDYRAISAEAKKNSLRFLWSKTVDLYNGVVHELLGETVVSPKVNVMVLTHNGLSFLDKNMKSIDNQTYKNFDVTILDNGSTDGSPEFIARNYPQVQILKLEKNLGFCRAYNIGIRKFGDGDYVLFLNDDTELKPNAIAQMVMTALGHPRAAGIAPKMMIGKERNVFDAIGTLVDFDGSPYNRGIGQIDIGQYDREEEVFGACFGGALIRRDLFDERKVGLFDESFEAYFEDTDWCFRARGQGYQFITCPKAVILHHHSGTWKKLGYEKKYFLIQRNFIKAIVRNFGLKNALKKTIKRYRSLFSYLNVAEPERKKTVLKIIFNSLASMPTTIISRYVVQRKRNPDITDEYLFSFSRSEIPYFNPEHYEPVWSLDNLEASYRRLYSLTSRRSIRKKLVQILTLKFQSSLSHLIDQEELRVKMRRLFLLLSEELTMNKAKRFLLHFGADERT